MNISSSRLAMEQIGGSSSPEKGRLGGVTQEESLFFITPSSSPFSGGEFETDIDSLFSNCHIPSLIPATAEDNCHFPPSIIMR